MNQIRLLLCALLIVSAIQAQVSIATIGETLSQNFNSLPGSPDNSTYVWTENSTLTGWYISTTTCRIESPASGMDNTGGIYTIVSGSDRSLGSKSSTSTGTLQYGMRLKNNTNQTITSLEVSFYGEQWSIAENESNVNSVTFSYQIGSTMTSLSSGTWTSVSALNFSQLYTSSQSAGMGGSACAGSMSQCLALDGNASSNRILVTACFDVFMESGSEIMLRWTDADTPANDHHLQIDEVSVSANDVSCSVALPVTWGQFDGAAGQGQNELWWQTITEANASHFEIERRTAATAFTSIGLLLCKGQSLEPTSYYFTDENPVENEINYYRLKQVDRNGAFEYSDLIAIQPKQNQELLARYDQGNECVKFNRPLKPGTVLTIQGLSGEYLLTTTTAESTISLPFFLAPGLYFVTYFEPGKEPNSLKLRVF